MYENTKTNFHGLKPIMEWVEIPAGIFIMGGYFEELLSGYPKGTINDIR